MKKKNDKQQDEIVRLNRNFIRKPKNKISKEGKEVLQYAPLGNTEAIAIIKDHKTNGIFVRHRGLYTGTNDAFFDTLKDAQEHFSNIISKNFRQLCEGIINEHEKNR